MAGAATGYCFVPFNQFSKLIMCFILLDEKELYNSSEFFSLYWLPANLKLNLFKYLFNIDLVGMRHAQAGGQVLLFPTSAYYIF